VQYRHGSLAGESPTHSRPPPARPVSTSGDAHHIHVGYSSTPTLSALSAASRTSWNACQCCRREPRVSTSTVLPHRDSVTVVADDALSFLGDCTKLRASLDTRAASLPPYNIVARSLYTQTPKKPAARRVHSSTCYQYVRCPAIRPLFSPPSSADKIDPHSLKTPFRKLRNLNKTSVGREFDCYKNFKKLCGFIKFVSVACDFPFLQ